MYILPTYVACGFNKWGKIEFCIKMHTTNRNRPMRENRKKMKINTKKFLLFIVLSSSKRMLNVQGLMLMKNSEGKKKIVSKFVYSTKQPQYDLHFGVFGGFFFFNIRRQVNQECCTINIKFSQMKGEKYQQQNARTIQYSIAMQLDAIRCDAIWRKFYLNFELQIANRKCIIIMKISLIEDHTLYSFWLLSAVPLLPTNNIF